MELKGFKRSGKVDSSTCFGPSCSLDSIINVSTVPK